jgi:hypothetical protein
LAALFASSGSHADLEVRAKSTDLLIQIGVTALSCRLITHPDRRTYPPKSTTFGIGLLSVLWAAVKRTLILHPFFFATFASLSLVSNNLTEIGGEGGRAVLVSFGFSAIVFAGFWVLTRDSLKAGLSASGAIVLFFSYGHVLNLVETWSVGRNYSALLLIIWGGFLAGWLYWVLKRANKLLPLSNALNLIAIALNVLPVFTILTYSDRPVSVQDLAVDYSRQFQIDSDLSPVEDPPDIYYIVLDAYARGDVLQELYDYDNSKFLDALVARGFHVDEEAAANYTHSEISMASSLNMNHLTDMPEFLRERGLAVSEDDIRGMSGELIRNSALRQVLEELGYAIVALDSGYGLTRITDADKYVSSPQIDDAGFWQIGIEFMLLDTTLGREIVGLLGEEASPHSKLFTAHRERVLFSLAELPQLVEDYPQFVFAHIISPHVPFVFGREGEEITGFDPYTLLDRRGGSDSNIELYRNQLHYLNSLVLETIDNILDAYDEPPIIVLQADHGSKVYSSGDHPDSVRMDLQVPILSARLIPRAVEQDYYAGMTPVNTFRQILNLYFDAGLDLESDVSYILKSDDNQTKFVEACIVYLICESP